MTQLFIQLHNIMKDSLNPKSPTSSTRYQSYLILLPILLMIFVTTGIELTSFIIAMYHAKAYVLSNEFIIVFGMVLAHHLSILFSRTKNPSISEVNQSITDIKGEEKPKETIEDSSEESQKENKELN